jgi:hypothetical protein
MPHPITDELLERFDPETLQLRPGTIEELSAKLNALPKEELEQAVEAIVELITFLESKNAIPVVIEIWVLLDAVTPRLTKSSPAPRAVDAEDAAQRGRALERFAGRRAAAAIRTDVPTQSAAKFIRLHCPVIR